MGRVTLMTRPPPDAQMIALPASIAARAKDRQSSGEFSPT